MSLLRPEIEALEINGIAKVALPHIGEPDIIPLWFGEGDRVTPDFIRDAAKRGLDEGYTFYSHTRGRQELRDALKRYLDRTYDMDINPDRLTVPGSTMLAITIASHMALNQGDHGLIVGPCWPNIYNTFMVTGAEVDTVRQQMRDGRWVLDMDELIGAVRPNTRVIFVNSPCNPTGWVMSRDEQQRLLEFCREREILILSDEVYHRNVFGTDVAPSFLNIASDDDPVICINGFSKAWAMTGWRLGWMVAPSRYAMHLAAMSECFNTGSTAFAQRGGVAALDEGDDFVREMQANFARGRQAVMEILAPHPRIELSEPEGAFYAFPKVAGLKDSLDFAQRLVAEEKVGVAPGYTFGPGNDAYFRICFAQSNERLVEALGRINAFLDRQDNALG